jgi:hypothetical protein
MFLFCPLLQSNVARRKYACSNSRKPNKFLEEWYLFEEFFSPQRYHHILSNFE